MILVQTLNMSRNPSGCSDTCMRPLHASTPPPPPSHQEKIVYETVWSCLSMMRLVFLAGHDEALNEGGALDEVRPEGEDEELL